MKPSLHADNPAGAVRFAGSLTIDEIETLRDPLTARCARSAITALDLGDVVACDAAGAQLLVSLARTLTAAGAAQPAVTRRSEAVERCFAELGLESIASS